jgi:hypothetical protein
MQAIQPTTSAAKSKTGQPYVAAGFDVVAIPNAGGGGDLPRVIFKTGAGTVLPDGVVPLVPPATKATEATALLAAIAAGTALAGEAPAATLSRVCASTVVSTRGVVLAPAGA